MRTSPRQADVAVDIPAGDPRVALLTELRAALWIKQNFLQRLVQTDRRSPQERGPMGR